MATAEFEINDDLKTLKATELRLGLPGSDHESPSSPCVVVVKNNNNKRCSSENQQEQLSPRAPAPKSQVVGWPPVRCYRINALNNQQQKQSETITPFVKVSMDGAPYLRKIDLNCYKDYSDLLKALEIMFNCNLGVYSEREGCHGSEHAPTYEDKDGDWMLVGDVPWDMFARSCKRVRIMKGSQAKGGVKQQLL